MCACYAVDLCKIKTERDRVMANSLLITVKATANAITQFTKPGFMGLVKWMLLTGQGAEDEWRREEVVPCYGLRVSVATYWACVLCTTKNAGAKETHSVRDFD